MDSTFKYATASSFPPLLLEQIRVSVPFLHIRHDITSSLSCRNIMYKFTSLATFKLVYNSHFCQKLLSHKMSKHSYARYVPEPFQPRYCCTNCQNPVNYMIYILYIYNYIIYILYEVTKDAHGKACRTLCKVSLITASY